MLLVEIRILKLRRRSGFLPSLNISIRETIKGRVTVYVIDQAERRGFVILQWAGRGESKIIIKIILTNGAIKISVCVSRGM